VEESLIKISNLNLWTLKKYAALRVSGSNLPIHVSSQFIKSKTLASIGLPPSGR
jgi:hypothetical protein